MAKQFGKWAVESQLGEGGQAHTFLVRANDDEKRRLYVLKRLKNKNRIARFQREMQACCALSHPNIVRVIDSNMEHDPPYLVMEYCEKGSLEKNHAPGKSVLDVLRLVEPVCQGVAHAHEQKIVHRDLKPGNVYLTAENVPVVGDFGLCFVEDGQRFTVTEEAVGPRHYMAPELEDGRAEQVSPRSDVYSLGKVLYWMLTGKSFAREKHREAGYDLTKTATSTPPFLVYELLDRMITGDPAGRFADASALLSAVRQAIRRIEMNAHAIRRDAPQPCTYCGVGLYRWKVDYAVTYTQRPGVIGPPEQSVFGTQEMHNFVGTTFAGSRWIFFVCDYCGHVAMFRPDLGDQPEIWGRPRQA